MFFLQAQTNTSSRPAEDAIDKQPRRSNSPIHNTPPESATASKKRHRSTENEDDLIVNTEINKVQAYKTTAPQHFKVQIGLPWVCYKEVLRLDLNGPVTIAEQKAPQYGLVAIKVFPSTAAEKALKRHQHIKHDNIVAVLDAFTTDTSLYIVLEHLPISLKQIVEGAKYPTESQLAAILIQVRRL